MTTLFPDPLRINYLVILGDDELREASPFQGFGPSWSGLIWAFELLAQLPSDVLEPSHPRDGVTSQRMGGMRQLLWSPLSISPLEKFGATDLGLFVVLMSAETEITERTSRWVKSQLNPILHISVDGNCGSISLENFSQDVLLSYCKDVFASRGQELSESRRSVVEHALEAWQSPETVTVDHKAWMHNITLPNQMALARAKYQLQDPEPFIGKTEDEYSKIIVDSAGTVIAVRENAGYQSYHRMSLIHPVLFLAEPAFYRHAYARTRPHPLLDKTAASALRIMQTQKGLCTQASTELGKQLVESPKAQQMIALRQEDLTIFTAALGLKAAQTCSAVVRLSPGVNHVFPILGNYARNIRSGNASARLKTPRLFQLLQDNLLKAVGEKRVEFIEEVGGPIKIVSDAPVELLPINGLPLMLRYDCSRVCATPGNLLLSQLAMSEPVTVTPEQIRRVLVISSFKDDDPLRNMMVGSLDAIASSWIGKVDVQRRRATSRSELISALNESDASILVFDGHGNGNSDTGIATLRMGNEDVDVWQLRGEAKIPPIVILSACDTQGIDAKSHATVGNGFLAAGAQTVLATLLPVGGLSSASFVARLIYRLADFIPAALQARQRVLNWTEIISGMQRMLLASEILDVLIGPIGTAENRSKIQTAANMEINQGNPNWFEWLVNAIAEERQEELGTVSKRVSAIISRSESIRYIQLGSPENILIDDGSIRNLFIPEELQKLLNV